MYFENYRRNIFKWGLILKVSSKEIYLCNRILILMLGVETMIISILKLCACMHFFFLSLPMTCMHFFLSLLAYHMHAHITKRGGRTTVLIYGRP